MAFFLNTVVTATIFIEERADGVWDRTLIAGVSASTLLWSHLITQVILLIIQNVEIGIFAMITWSSYNQGSTVALAALMCLVSLGGMFYGKLATRKGTSPTSFVQS